MKALQFILFGTLVAALAFSAGVAVDRHRAVVASACEDTDQVAGLSMGAYDSAISKRLHPIAAPHELSVAQSVCEFRHVIAPDRAELADRERCAARVLGWAKYWTQQVEDPANKGHYAQLHHK